jgi:hypothetical protein
MELQNFSLVTCFAYETQVRSQFETPTQNIPELGISCIPLTEYYTDLSSTLI